MIQRIGPLLMLTLGVVIAAAFGAQIGDHQTRYRIANAAIGVQADRAAEASAALENRDTLPPDQVARLEREQADAERARDAARAARDQIGLPTPRARVAEWFSVGGVGWLIGCALIAVGAVAARRQQHAELSGAGGTGAGADFPGAVRTVLDEIDRLSPMLADMPMDGDAPAVREALDALADLVIGPLVDARGQLVARHGLAVFAGYFGPFSGGERNLARTWSAITDGHADEARASLVAARAAFEDSLVQWDRAVQAAARIPA